MKHTRLLILALVVLAFTANDSAAQQAVTDAVTAPSPPTGAVNNSPILQVQEALTFWGRSFFAWTVVHYLLGIGGTVLSVIIAAKSDFRNKRVLRILAVVSASCVALLTFLGPLKKAKLYHNAWRQLSAENNKYLHTGGVTVAALLEKKDECEKSIEGFFAQ